MRAQAYSEEQRARAVGTALVVGDERAGALLNIPRRTVSSWRRDPRFAHLREVAQDQLARSMWLGVVLALQATVEGLNDPKAPLRDKALTLGILADKALLLTGMATRRTETVSADPLQALSADEQQDLRQYIDAIDDEIAQLKADGAA